MLKLACLAALAAAGLAAAAPALAAPSSSACFRLSDIQNTKMQGERTLFMRSSTGAYYRMDFGADCNNIGEPLILHPVDNSGEVCTANALDIRVRGTGQACIPTNLSRLTPDEVAAIPPSDKP
jgi:hypothetical protein